MLYVSTCHMVIVCRKFWFVSCQCASSDPFWWGPIMQAPIRERLPIKSYDWSSTQIWYNQEEKRRLLNRERIKKWGNFQQNFFHFSGNSTRQTRFNTNANKSQSRLREMGWRRYVVHSPVKAFAKVHTVRVNLFCDSVISVPRSMQMGVQLKKWKTLLPHSSWDYWSSFVRWSSFSAVFSHRPINKLSRTDLHKVKQYR